jgi:hypothetical protein
LATVKFYDNDALMSGEHTEYTVDSVARWILDNIQPAQAFSVFCGDVNQSNSVPITAESLAALGDGDYTIMLTPAAAAVPYIVALVVAVAVVALTPKPNLPTNVSRGQESPNNQLSSRSNTARPLQRIPDINGEVLSIPDVIMPEYTIYENDAQKIRAYYCAGVNDVLISSVKDSDTPIEFIADSGVAIFGPNKNPNTDAPDYTVGEPQDWEIVTPYRLEDVNGIHIGAGAGTVVSVRRWANPFGDTDRIYLERSNGAEWDDFDVGDQVYINLSLRLFSTWYPLSGDYTVIDKIFSGSIYWLVINAVFFPGTSEAANPARGNVSTLSDQNTDWAYFTRDAAQTILINVVAADGIYSDNGGDDIEYLEVPYSIMYQQLDANNNAIGEIVEIDKVISGDDRTQRAQSTEIEWVASRFRVRLGRRPLEIIPDGVYSDNIRWNDCYALVDIPVGHDFGNITTIQTETKQTIAATSIKERQLNCIAQEQLEPYINSTTQGALAPNTSAVQSFIRSALDPTIGNRPVSEIDIDGLLAVEQEIITYFGSDHSTKFAYTMDSTEVSFQEYAQMVFNAINCIAYRDGSTIKAIFEKPVVAPSMLFTHRSKIPGTERYTRNFNPSTINDGVEFNWVSPATERTETILLADNPPAINPLVLNIAGIRDEKQAIIRANREYNKVKLSKMNLDVSVTAEGRYVLPNSVVSVVKGSRVYTEDGEVIDQNGLILTLSQDVDFSGVGPFSIVLKKDDGTTEYIIVTAGTLPNQVVLAGAPSETIRTSIDSRRTEFSFGSDERLNSQWWMAQEIDISQKLQVGLKCINYDEGYYSGDDVNLGAYSSGYSDGYDIS